jgi:hypothetical protein
MGSIESAIATTTIAYFFFLVWNVFTSISGFSCMKRVFIGLLLLLGLMPAIAACSGSPANEDRQERQFQGGEDEEDRGGSVRQQEGDDDDEEKGESKSQERKSGDDDDEED